MHAADERSDAPDDPGRATFLRTMTGAATAVVAGMMIPGPTRAANAAMQKRPIPSTREALPVIGCGTYVGFDVTDASPEFQRLPQVVDTLLDAGGSVFDSSPMYGRAEAVTGRLLAAPGKRERAFVATKVWTSGREAGIRQMETSMRLLLGDRKDAKLDLLQVHNLLDVRTHLATLAQWKAAGRVRYVGVTHYTSSAYPELEAVMKGHRLDFVQINHAIDDREAESRILPLAADRGIAVLINRPFGGGGLLRRLRDRPLPTWAAEIGATAWSQVLLKFVLAHPAVTCAIPGTGNPEHMAENARAGSGEIPDRAFWESRIPSLVN